MVEQFVQPVATRRSRIRGLSISKYSPRAWLRGEVASRRVIAVRAHNAAPAASVAAQLRHRAQPVEHRRIVTAIVDNQQFVLGVRGFLQQAFDTTLQGRQLVPAAMMIDTSGRCACR